MVCGMQTIQGLSFSEVLQMSNLIFISCMSFGCPVGYQMLVSEVVPHRA